MAGAAALALPEFDRVLAFQRDAQSRSDTGRRVEREPRPRRWRPCARASSRPTRAGRAQPKRARPCTSIARSAAGSRRRARHTRPVSPPLTTPLARGAAKRFVDLAPAEQDAVLRARADPVLCARADAHHSRHVLRSGIRRQRELRRLGSDWISGRAAQRDGRRSAHGRRRLSRFVDRPTTTRCSRRERH